MTVPLSSQCKQPVRASSESEVNLDHQCCGDDGTLTEILLYAYVRSV